MKREGSRRGWRVIGNMSSDVGGEKWVKDPAGGSDGRFSTYFFSLVVFGYVDEGSGSVRKKKVAHLFANLIKFAKRLAGTAGPRVGARV